MRGVSECFMCKIKFFKMGKLCCNLQLCILITTLLLVQYVNNVNVTDGVNDNWVSTLIIYPLYVDAAI